MFNLLPGTMITRQKLRVVTPGGAGHLGRLLAHHFHGCGHAVTILTRHASAAGAVPWRVVQWNGRDPGDWAQELDGADVVINLAGRSVNCRYSAANRREIKES